MELRQVKSNIVAAQELLSHAAEEIQKRVTKGNRIDEQDLKELQIITLPLIVAAENIDSNLWRYGRQEYGSKLFRPTATFIENPVRE